MAGPAEHTTPNAQQAALLDAFAAWQRGEIDAAPVTQLLGVEPVEIGEGRAVVRMSAGPSHHNPFGSVHGGLLCALADVAMGLALSTTLDGEGFTTLEEHMNHLRSVGEAVLTAEAEVARRGRRAAHLRCAITSADGKTIAEASETCLVFPFNAP